MTIRSSARRGVAGTGAHGRRLLKRGKISRRCPLNVLTSQGKLFRSSAESILRLPLRRIKFMPQRPTGDPRNDTIIAGVPDLQTCVNPECTAAFKKLGDGILFAKTVDDPLAWGLPSGKKQKVVWLCSGCAKTRDVVFDTARKQVVLQPRPARRKAAAA